MDKLMEPSSTLQWVDRTLVKPNDYNPNKVSKQNLELLTQSIFTNGWTLPIVVRRVIRLLTDSTGDVAGPEWKVCAILQKRTRERCLNVLEVRCWSLSLITRTRQVIFTAPLPKTWARGTHLLEPMKKIVKELMEEGKSVEEIGKQLGMRPEEIFRLSEFSKEDFLKMMVQEKKNFSKAEYITKI